MHNKIGHNIFEEKKVRNATVKRFVSNENCIKLTHIDGTVTASLTHYDVVDGELEESPLDAIVSFSLDGEVIDVQSVGGVAEIGFTSEVPGRYTIKTVNAGVQNGEVTINV